MTRIRAPMLFLEHDAKELLAIQGIPIPGGIQLAQAPTAAAQEKAEATGHWRVKPQVLIRTAGHAPHAVSARTNAEIADAASRLLTATIDGQTVHAVLVERAIQSRSVARLSFQCEPRTAGIRIQVGDGAADGAARSPTHSEIVAPDPTAVIAGVQRLSTALSPDARSSVAAAGRMLAPLYFGYEAILMEIDPLMILADGSWMVGDVRMAIDEAALFRHPELITLLERRDAYGNIRQLRATGVDYRILDPTGNVAIIACGAGHCAYLLDELIARGLKPYDFMDAGAAMLNGPPERLDDVLQWLQAAAGLRCILVAVGDGAIDLTAFAQHFAAALDRTEGLKTPVVARFAGTGAGAAGAILQQASGRVLFEPDIGLALDLVAAQVAGAPG